MLDGIRRNVDMQQRRFPPRSISTPYQYHPRSNRINENRGLVNKKEEVVYSSSYLDSFSAEEKSLICELQDEEKTEYDHNLQEIFKRQQESIRDANKTVTRFSNSLRSSKKFAPRLAEAANNYKKSEELRASLETISQFRDINSDTMTPMNQDLF